MGFFRRFEVFDPKDGDVPSYPFNHLASIALRARRLLSYRSREQIITAANNIDWIIVDYFSKDITLPDTEITSEVTALKEAISSYALDDDTDIPNAKEREYFAVLALWRIEDSLEWIELKHQHSLSLAGDAALDAMDAVCYAEYLEIVDLISSHFQSSTSRFEEELRLSVDKEVEEKTKQKISLNSKKNAIKRHADSTELKRIAVDLFLAKTWPSTRQAAKKIYPQLVLESKEMDFTFSAERGEQTVYEWLLEASKGMRKQADV